MESSKKSARRRKLTELFVRKVKPEPTAFLIWDTMQRGLVLRVYPTGRKSWLCIYRGNGRPRWLRLGDAEAIALGDARQLAAEMALAVARGGDPGAEKKTKRNENTFADVARRYVDEHAKKHNKSWEQADTLIRRFAIPRWGKLQASAITRTDVKALMSVIKAPILANQTLAAISAVFAWGVREEVVTDNPARGVARNPTKVRERVLGASELPALWAALDDVEPIPAAALRVVLLLGQRPGEIRHMRREHLKDGWWELPGEPIPDIWPGTKNGRTHRVWIPAPAKAIIADLLDDNAPTGFVFAGQRGGPLVRLDKPVRELCAKLAIEPPLRPHDLRRTHGSTITALGFGRDAMNRIQNHAEGGIADVYDRHHYSEETKHIMEAVAVKIMGLIEGRTDEKVVSPHGREIPPGLNLSKR
jgi:integrase